MDPCKDTTTAAVRKTQTFIELIRHGVDPTNFDLCTITYTLDIIRSLIIATAAFEAIVGLALTAYMYFTAFGDEAKAQKAKQRIYWIVIGMIIILLSEIIIYEIQRFVQGAPPAPIDNVANPLLGG